MATTAGDPPVYRAHQDGLLPSTRVGAGPASYSAGSYYTPAPVGPAPRWPKHASFYPLDKPRRQAKPAGAREPAKPALRSKPSQKDAASKPSKVPPSMRRAPTASSEDLDLPSTPSPRATAANDLFSDSTNSRNSSTPSPTPASPPAQPKPALRQPPTITASGSSSFTSSRRLSLEGSPANILFPHQSFSTTYSSRSHDSYLHPHLSTTAASRLPKRVSFAVNLESPLTRTPAPAPQPSQLSAAAPAPRRRASPPPPSQPHLHTSLRACRHRNCTACTAAAATKPQAPEPAAIKQQAPEPAVAYPAAVQQLVQQLDSICSSYSTSSSSSSLTDPASAAADPTPRGPPTPPLEIEDASYENPTFADSEEIFHTPRSVDEGPQPAPHKQAAGPLTRSSSAAIRRPDSPVLPMPILTPSYSLNPLHRPTATSVSRPAGPMAPHHLPVTSDQTVPRHPALFSGSRPRATADAPTPATAPATPAEPSTPRTAATTTPLASPKRSPMRSLQARLAALATAPVAAISSMGTAASPRAPATPRSPHIEPTSLSADAAAAKPSLSLRARLQMPSTFLRTHSSLATASAPATPPSNPPPAKASSKASVLQALSENGYERQKSGWGLLMWDSSAAVTRKPSAAQHSLFGFEAAMLAEIQAQKAREAEEAYKVGPANSIIGSCGGWKETEAAQQRAALKAEAAAPGAGAAGPGPAAGAGFVNLGANPGAKTVAPFGCFMPFVRSKKNSKVREIR